MNDGKCGSQGPLSLEIESLICQPYNNMPLTPNLLLNALPFPHEGIGQ